MLKIGDLSKLVDVSVKTIRFYEEEGLIRPIEVDRWTGYRYYDDSSVERISQIVYLKSLGFTLKEIANLSEQSIIEKTKEIQNKIITLNDSVRALNSLRKEKG
ncbi:MAG: MerR family transcriptional regulator [Clostridia bacterium]|nr:MerR family transcriptional regulator [Clostridia bacterium]